MERQPDTWTRVDQHIDQPVSIKLERGQKGGYGWEIKVYAENFVDALVFIENADKQLRQLYAGGCDNAKPPA